MSRKLKALKIFYIVVVVISTLIVAGYVFITFGVRPPPVDQSEVPTPPVHTQGASGPAGSEPPDDEPGLRRRDQVYTCLIFGIDKVSGSTDTIMAATFDVPEGKIGLMSIPRDTVVRQDLGAASNKVNAAYAMGGAEQLAQELEELLGIPIDFYVKIRLEAFQRLVDAVGGVWFDVPFYMNYSDPIQNLYINQPAGYRLLTGKDAMEVVRYRQDNYGNDSFGDTGRAGLQQEFLKVMLSQVVSGAGLGDIPELVNILLNYVETDATLNDMLYFGRALVGMDVDSAVSTGTLAAVWTYPPGYMVVTREEALEQINTLLNPYDGEITEDMVEFIRP